MKILAMDSSGLPASAAILENGTLLAEYTVNFKMTHSQTLLPMIDTLMQMTGTRPEELDALAISGGPGSFTGLRIGAATAKGIGLAWNLPIISVPTVDALAWNLYGAAGLVCPMMDARRTQVYTGLYRFGTDMEVLMEQAPMALEEVISRIHAAGGPVILLGDGVPVYRELLREKLQVPWQEAPAHLNRQRAGAVASLAMHRLCGTPAPGEDPWQIRAPELLVPAEKHVPEYLRKSQAERERERKQYYGKIQC